jgi:hypothetical protein
LLTTLTYHKGEANRCRFESKNYLDCRMSNNLMAQETPEYLGFSDKDVAPWTAHAKTAEELAAEANTKAGERAQKKKEAEIMKGFIAGISVQTRFKKSGWQPDEEPDK